jgi:hypothetical protein
MNFCTTCGLDFASVAAFDAHRVGKHAYTFSEGLRMDPPREDGRRCLDPDEMKRAGWKRDGRGRWVDPKEARRPRRQERDADRRGGGADAPERPPTVESTPDVSSCGGSR